MAAALLAIPCAFAQAPQSVCSVAVLPESVRVALASQYPDWRVETVGDLEGDYQKAWIAKRPSDCPGFASGHFESNADLSYALLLIPRDKGKVGYRFLVFSSKSGKETYSSSLLEQSDKDAIGSSAIFRVDPGLHFNEQKFAAFKLKSEGIYLEFFETSGFIYYWKHGRYEHVVESD